MKISKQKVQKIYELKFKDYKSISYRKYNKLFRKERHRYRLS